MIRGDPAVASTHWETPARAVERPPPSSYHGQAACRAAAVRDAQESANLQANPTNSAEGSERRPGPAPTVWVGLDVFRAFGVLQPEEVERPTRGAIRKDR